MSKNRISIPAMIFCGSLLLVPGLSQASPLSWMPGPAALAKIARLWNFLPGPGHHAPVARTLPTKNGCGIDPQGQPLCQPGSGSGTTTQSGGDPEPGI